MSNKIINKTRLPYSFFVWIFLCICLSVIVFLYTNWVGGIIFTLLFSFFSYMIICRYACKITYDDKSLIIEYPFPIFEKRIIEIKRGMSFSYELGYYYYWNSEHLLGPIQFLHPHDTILFYENNEIVSILNVNTNHFDFKLLRGFLERNFEWIRAYEK